MYLLKLWRGGGERVSQQGHNHDTHLHEILPFSNDLECTTISLRERERKECTKSGLGGIVAVYDIYHDDSSATSGTH